jgi:hypothetical protein
MHIYDKIFTIKKTIGFCLLSWCVGVLIDLPNFLGWGGHYYDEKALGCLWNRLASHSYNIFFPMTTIVIPSFLVFICYSRIFWFIRKKGFKNNTNTAGRDFKKSIKIAQGLFASFLFFTLCWVIKNKLKLLFY